mmetsp:Transcript_33044/g.106875  ORF Transcript_33044/g.106875 Transcript_33044/m.106875 type:complete len:329 (-) Transcript_33044:53-1039(-)
MRLVLCPPGGSTPPALGSRRWVPAASRRVAFGRRCASPCHSSAAHRPTPSLTQLCGRRGGRQAFRRPQGAEARGGGRRQADSLRHPACHPRQPRVRSPRWRDGRDFGGSRLCEIQMRAQMRSTIARAARAAVRAAARRLAAGETLVRTFAGVVLAKGAARPAAVTIPAGDTDGGRQHPSTSRRSCVTAPSRRAAIGFFGMMRSRRRRRSMPCAMPLPLSASSRRYRKTPKGTCPPQTRAAVRDAGGVPEGATPSERRRVTWRCYLPSSRRSTRSPTSRPGWLGGRRCGSSCNWRQMTGATRSTTGWRRRWRGWMRTPTAASTSPNSSI